jgi:hypothetical protein
MAGRPRPRSHRAGWTAHERAAAARHVHAGLVGSHRRQERTMRGCPSGRRAAPRRTSRWHHPRPNTRSSPTTASRPEPTPSPPRVHGPCVGGCHTPGTATRADPPRETNASSIAAPDAPATRHHARPNTRSLPTIASQPGDRPHVATTSSVQSPPLRRRRPGSPIAATSTRATQDRTPHPRQPHDGPAAASTRGPAPSRHRTSSPRPDARPDPIAALTFNVHPSVGGRRAADRRHQHTRDARPNASSPATPRCTGYWHHPETPAATPTPG